MPSYAAPLRETRYLLRAVLDVQAHARLPGLADVAPDVVEAVLAEGARFCEDRLFPLNRSGDEAGCVRHADGGVTTPARFREAYAAIVADCWSTLAAPAAHGGQGMPQVVSTAFEEYLVSANMAFAMYPGLTHGAIAAIAAKGSAAQQATWLPRMVSGEWSGTMNLTEPHCGTDLGLIRTRAEPREDGSHAITGGKIFISAGEHDLTGNIVHLVLARIAGAPEGVKGISLFIVPKFLLDENGEPGARNAVSCGSIEEKMGIHGNATCAMNFDGAVGWLVGEPNKGLGAMFVMMNAARLGVGLQGLGVAEVAYQNAVAYARERRQGRALTGPAEPDQKADTLFVHPDVRRMLMEAKASVEGARALCLWTALQSDLARHGETAEARAAANDLVSLVTPVVKGHVTDIGYKVATDAQQVHGGHGYIREWGMEQYVRDARIAQIYEGANGVQAMDLAGRKLGLNGGRAAMALMALIAAETTAGKADPASADVAARLEKALGELQAASLWMMKRGMIDPDDIGAAAYPFMTLAGIVAIGWMWLKMARASAAAIANGDGDRAFHEAKLVTARFYAERILPDAGALRRKIESGSESIMALPAEAF